MSKFELDLDPASEQRLRELAASLNLPLHELLAAAVRDLLSRSPEDSRGAADHVLKKNEDLYKRLS